MKQLIQSIFGTYTPVTYERFATAIDSTTGTQTSVLEKVIPDGLAGCDWTYILGVVAFLIVLYSVLRIIGGVISRV